MVNNINLEKYEKLFKLNEKTKLVEPVIERTSIFLLVLLYLTVISLTLNAFYWNIWVFFAHTLSLSFLISISFLNYENIENKLKGIVDYGFFYKIFVPFFILISNLEIIFSQTVLTLFQIDKHTGLLMISIPISISVIVLSFIKVKESILKIRAKYNNNKNIKEDLELLALEIKKEANDMKSIEYYKELATANRYEHSLFILKEEEALFLEKSAVRIQRTLL